MNRIEESDDAIGKKLKKGRKKKVRFFAMMIFKIGVMKMYPVQVPRYKRFFLLFFFLSLLLCFSLHTL